MHQLGVELSLNLALVLVIISALLALPLALVITLALIRLIRSRVGRSMRATGGEAGHPEPQQPFRHEPHGALEIDPVPATRERADASRAAPLLAEARRRGRRLAAIHGAAAGAYPLLMAGAFVATVDFSPRREGVLKFILLYSLFALQLGTPAALVPTLVLRRQPRFLILALVALVVAIWTWGRSLGVPDPLALWLMLGAVPTVVVVLLNGRRLRAIGPIVFAAMLLLLYGVCAGATYATFYAWDAIGPVRFVREDLAALPFVVANEKYAADLFRLPPGQMRAEISALLSEPSRVIRAANPDGLTLKIQLHSLGIWLAASAVGAAAAVAFLRRLARSYRARRASDQMLAIDVLMLIFTVPLSLVFAVSSSPVLAAAALGSFVGYKLLARWGLRRRQRSARPYPARTLLLLRVFGFEGRTQRLLEDLGQRWRYLGPIRLIAGTDLVDATIEPHEFFEFLNGRLTRAFVKDRDDLERRLSAGPASPDPDGRFRIEDFFCHEATWRMTVSRLARDADAVLMDLRGFTPTNRGCIFEIEQLCAAVPLHRVVLLVDGSTDGPFLEQTLQDAWGTMPGDSPNVGTGTHRVRVLKASGPHGRTLDTLLGLLCETFAERGEAKPASP